MTSLLPTAVHRLGLPAALLAAATLLALACSASRPAILYGPAAQLDAQAYPDILATWTRSAKVYQGIENKLFITATFHSPEFRRAFAIAFPDIYGHGGEITRRELVDLTGDVEQYHTFFVSMYTPNTKWNDLAKNDSIWRLKLTGSGDAGVGPDEIVPIKIDENLRSVYPYIGHFDRAYLVRFPLADPLRTMVIGPETEAFKLRVASALGEAELRWDLVPLK